MTRIPFPSAPILRTRGPGDASARSAEGVSPSVVGIFGLPFASDEAVSPSVVGIFGLPFAADDAVGASVFGIPPLPFAEDGAE
jgi:hypothetical protein